MKAGTIFDAYHRISGKVRYTYVGECPDEYDRCYKHKLLSDNGISYVDDLWFDNRKIDLVKETK